MLLSLLGLTVAAPVGADEPAPASGRPALASACGVVATDDPARDFAGAGDPAKALADLDRALARNPEDVDALARWGTLRVEAPPNLDLAYLNLALADLNRALALDPTHRDALPTRAVAYPALGKPVEAARDAEAAVRLGADQLEMRIILGIAHLVHADGRGAVAEFDEGSGLIPTTR